ncbi:unnamed protein product [Schistosoma curassoni]|uniref:Ovule protein n=1 Tax=Schistosoma curassoni TaxID=6186 RepID=A0A183K2P7_9TREM|nr:unnamed protein product [Schistosoma curassoni]
MYLHLRVDAQYRTPTKYRSFQTPWLAVESRRRVSSYSGLVSWMYLHLRVDVHTGTQTQYHYPSLRLSRHTHSMHICQ